MLSIFGKVLPPGYSCFYFLIIPLSGVASDTRLWHLFSRPFEASLKTPDRHIYDFLFGIHWTVLPPRIPFVFDFI